MMSNRRDLLLTLAFAAFPTMPSTAAEFVDAGDAFAELDDRGIQIPELKELLEKGLRARLPREFAFIGRVVTYVDQGKLPLKMVLSVFHWARRQVVSRKYPFPYFERALRILAARQGVKLP